MVVAIPSWCQATCERVNSEGLDRDGIVRDGHRASQFGRYNGPGCSCHRHWDNDAGNRREVR